MQQDTIFEDSFSEEIWNSTYKDHGDETLDSTFKRVAKAISSVEKTETLRLMWEDNFYRMLTGFSVVAGGRIYANAGTEFNGTSLLNCFVSPDTVAPIDSVEGISEALLMQIKTLKSEGGFGYNFSTLRPRGSFIKTIGVESPGAVKYMELFDKSSDIITAGSGKKSTNIKAKKKIRKGAQMGILNDWHPDIIEFITAKQQPGRLQKFNMSVNISDEFMNRLKRINELKAIDEVEIEELNKWNLIFPDTTFSKYNSEWDGNIKLWQSKGYPVTVHNTITVVGLWNLIMESTYTRAEPGVIFGDRINEYNPLNYVEFIQTTNPCGEQVLASGGVCCLSSLNLTEFINSDRTDFDYSKMELYIRFMVRFLDNVNSYSSAPLPEYKYNMENKRRIGCGVLGWGSSLFLLKVRFGSEKAYELQQKLMKFFTQEAYKASIDLAVDKGMFTLCDPVKHANGKFIKNLDLPQEYMDKLLVTGIRNSALTSIQPTGNGACFAQILSGGCEPLFMSGFIRTVIVNYTPDHIKDITPKWNEGAWHETEMFKFVNEGSDELLRGVDSFGVVYKIDKNRGLTKEVLCEDRSVRLLKSYGEWNPDADWVVTTTQLTAEEHLNDLKGFAKWIDSAISKTINLPFEYPFDDFKNIYSDAWDTGYIKGLTTYRSGTMMSVLSNVVDEDDEEIILENAKISSSQPAVIKTLKSEGRKWYLTVVMDTSGKTPIGIFVHTNNSEKTVSTHDAIERLLLLARNKGIPENWVMSTEKKMENDNNATKIARAIGLCLRHGIHIKNVVKVLNEVDVTVGTFLFQIRKFLSQYIKNGTKIEGAVCDNCGGKNIIFSEGCSSCKDCGSSKCS